MFVTDDSAHHPFATRLFGDGRNIWRAVSLATHNEWFYVSFDVKTPEGVFGETFLISKPADDLLSFVDQPREDAITITDIQLVSPPHVNGSDQWRMESLVRIWRNPEDAWSIIYDVANGNRYCTVTQKEADKAEFELCREFAFAHQPEPTQT
ncbi:hypothetical protein ETQ85_24955 [Zoogloea oleivorans]|uniref:Uncharacterized protein n=1 Tax=Zoogloea oleivorans TaxID=1552750 RepID=A0A6C2CBR1_9RHOO|nr:hypothetical protein [Zoogloea oleivorans]TYC50783.1 hypothetical protein ETQ85_24955 [Zoogloea oleivorans]